MAATKKLTKAQVLKFAKEFGEKRAAYVTHAIAVIKNTIERVEKALSEISAASNGALNFDSKMRYHQKSHEIKTAGLLIWRTRVGGFGCQSNIEHTSDVENSSFNMLCEPSSVEAIVRLERISDSALYNACLAATQKFSGNVNIHRDEICVEL